MSTPEHIDNPIPATTSSSPATSTALDVAKAIWQLRALVCGLGLVLLVVSATLSVFVWKQNRNLSAETGSRNAQVAQLQANAQRLTPLLNELAQLSREDPGLTAVFQRFNISVGPRPDASATTPASSTP
jgi:hypothetical protein